ncbi:hypothetical protein cyc_06539 [Cyclospora cayetanensis]|uniref:Uncharacterized protein n=1 Tax=Cyclospora cayetanensis TaxID=88456 RepID=A0A1D3D4F5_9EIME|nr:hypothetical protein cyc_06539 [Cyclospora cayetanensis]
MAANLRALADLRRRAAKSLSEVSTSPPLGESGSNMEQQHPLKDSVALRAALRLRVMKRKLQQHASGKDALPGDDQVKQHKAAQQQHEQQRSAPLDSAAALEAAQAAVARVLAAKTSSQANSETPATLAAAHKGEDSAPHAGGREAATAAGEKAEAGRGEANCREASSLVLDSRCFNRWRTWTEAPRFYLGILRQRRKMAARCRDSALAEPCSRLEGA